RAVRRSAQFAELDDLAVLDPDIAPERRHPRAVDDAPVLDQQVICHPFPFLRSGHATRFLGESVTRCRGHPDAKCEALPGLHPAKMRARYSENRVFGP